MHILPSRRVLLELIPDTYYPYGKTRSRNVLQDYNVGLSARSVKVLLVGVADLQTALQTSASWLKNSVKLEYYVNETSIINTARNILILKIISSPEFNANSSEDLEYIWSVWYDVCWSEAVVHRFQADVGNLVNGHFPENVKLPSAKNLQVLMDIWKEWLTAVSTKLSDKNLTAKILADRFNIIMAGWQIGLEKDTDYKADFEHTNAMLVRRIEEHMGVQNFPHHLKLSISYEAYSYFFDLRDDFVNQDEEKFYINVTLLEPKSYSWLVHHTVCPFNGYLPLPIDELEATPNGDTASIYCRKVLKDHLLAYKMKKDKITWVFHVGNSLELCYSINEKFHAIDCCGLADEVGLANVLNAAGTRLSDEIESILIVDSVFWRSLAPTLIRYVEEALCAPLSMLPSIYGLRLADAVQLGALTPPAPTVPVCFTWRRTPSFENFRPKFSPSLRLWLEKLAQKCFSSSEEFSGELCGMKCYTPLTFLYVVQYAARRMDRTLDILEECEPFMKLKQPFHLMWRTLRHWSQMASTTEIPERRRSDPPKLADIQLMSTSVTFDRIKTDAFLTKFGAKVMTLPILRLVLLPKDVYQDLEMDQSFDIFSCSDVHCVDNVQLRFVKDSSSGWVRVYFPLVADHNLDFTHSGVVLDVQTGLPLIPIGPVRSLQTESFIESLPFDGDLSEVAIERLVLNGCYLSVINSQETEYDYVIRLRCNASKLNGLTWLTDQQPPCESAHRIVLSFNMQSAEVLPLTICVPYPFLADEVILSTITDDVAELKLVKALYEPWPAQFTVKPNFSVDSLPSLQVPEELQHQFLSAHMEQQFCINDISKCSILSSKKEHALKQVRLLIGGVFELVLKGHSLVTIRCCHSDLGSEHIDNILLSEPDWYLRIHPPFRFTSNGTPVLIVSAFDYALAVKLISKGEILSEEVEADFKRICINEPRSMVPSVVLSDSEENNLFRFILRLNSTKMFPSSWQTFSVPLGESTPWVTTYLLPLYCDQLLSY